MIKKETTRLKRRIIYEGTESLQDHREDFETCPNCDYKMPSKKWDKIAHTLVLNPAFQKSHSVSILSDCPKCFEMSWVHWPLDAFYYNGPFPELWVDAIEAEQVKRIEAAKQLVKKSLCKRCKKRKGDFAKYNGWRHCVCGSGEPKTECNEFSAKKGK
jgi:hypothetical protein